jgi:hypothetical protein
MPGVPLEPGDDQEGPPAPATNPTMDEPSFHRDRRSSSTASTIGGIKKKITKLISPKTIPAPTSAHSQKPAQPAR